MGNVIILTVLALLSSITCLTDAEVFFAGKSVQAGRVFSTWVTRARILMMKNNLFAET